MFMALPIHMTTASSMMVSMNDENRTLSLLEYGGLYRLDMKISVYMVVPIIPQHNLTTGRRYALTITDAKEGRGPIDGKINGDLSW